MSSREAFSKGPEGALGARLQFRIRTPQGTVTLTYSYFGGGSLDEAMWRALRDARPVRARTSAVCRSGSSEIVGTLQRCFRARLLLHTVLDRISCWSLCEKDFVVCRVRT